MLCNFFQSENPKTIQSADPLAMFYIYTLNLVYYGATALCSGILFP